MDQQTIARLENDVVHGISRERLTEIYAQNFHCPVGLRAEQLCRIESRVQGESAGQIDGIPQVTLTRCAIRSGIMYLASHPHLRRALKIVPAEDSYRIEGLQNRRCCRISQRG